MNYELAELINAQAFREDIIILIVSSESYEKGLHFEFSPALTDGPPDAFLRMLRDLKNGLDSIVESVAKQLEVDG